MPQMINSDGKDLLIESNRSVLSQNQLDTDLAELKDIEDVIMSQLNELGKEIDSSFSKAAKMVESLTEMTYAISQGHCSDEAGLNILTAGAVAAETIEGVGNAYHAYKYNKALTVLLKQKQAIAHAKGGALLTVKPKLEHLTDRYAELMNHILSKEYELDNLREEEYSKLLYNNIDRALSMLRAASYNLEMTDYLLAEYKAWLHGEQQSKYTQPTLWDVNKKIVGILGSPDIKDAFKDGSSLRKRVSGKELCLLHDSQLLTFTISINTDEVFTPAFSSDIVALKKANPNLLPKPDFMDGLYEDIKHYNRAHYSIPLIYIGACVLWIACSVIMILLVSGTNWQTWIKWTVGVIGELAIIAAVGTAGYFCRRSANKRMTDIVKNTTDSFSKYAGYVYIPKKILEKQSVVGSFLSSFK